ncbi:MAG: aminopeptidase P family protein [Elusimicrobiales bacterium]|nr:aminopeptidase P family protein [Elusimicrobiales bacterium]
MNIHAKRIKDLQHLLRQNRLDAVVVARKLETYFLTGYNQDNVYMLVSRTGAWAFMPRMLLADFNAKVPFVDASAPDNLLDAVSLKVRELRLKKTAFEPETESYLRGNLWKKKGFVEQKGLTASLRAVKEGEEIGLLRKSCRIAAKAFGLIKPRIRTGRTELSVYRELEDLMQGMGASGTSFSLIVGFGPHSALPHHETSERKLRANEAVLLDYGCVYGGYCSDITRTYFHGRPTDEFKKVHAIVAASQKAGLKAVRAGVKTRLVDAACRDHIAEAGYGQYFIHGTGHGVGLEIHEAPTLNTKSEEVLRPGMAVTVEPGIYLHGKFGVRIEDSVLVTRTGCEILTKTA